MNALLTRLGALVFAASFLALLSPLHGQDGAAVPPKAPPADETPLLPPSDFHSELDLNSMVPVDPLDPADLPNLPEVPKALPPTDPNSVKTVTVPSKMPVVTPPAGKSEQGIAHDPPPAADLSNMPIVNVEVPPVDPPAQPAPAPEAPASKSEVPAETK